MALQSMLNLQYIYMKLYISDVKITYKNYNNNYIGTPTCDSAGLLYILCQIIYFDPL